MKRYLVLLFVFLPAAINLFSESFIEDINLFPYKKRVAYPELTKNGQVYIKCKEVGEVPVGKPQNIDPKRNYYEEGMNASKNKDYKTASDMLRHSYYQSSDNYRYFWYLYFLEQLKAWEVIDWEAKKAPEEHLFHPGYLTWARAIWARALREIGNYNESIKQYIYILKNNPKSAFDAAHILTEHYWAYDKMGPIFMTHPDHKDIMGFIVDQVENAWKEKSYNGGSIFTHLVVAASVAIRDERMKDAKEYVELLKRVDKNYDLINDGESYENRKTIIRAFDYYFENDPKKVENPPYLFKWLNFYVPEVDGIDLKDNKPMKVKVDKEIYERRIFDTKQQWAFVPIFYYYITQGRVLFDYEFKVYNGKYTEVTAGGYRPPAIESLNPYPSQFIYENIRNFGGIMWWHPSYDGVAYLGGPRGTIFIPTMLETKDWKLTTTMPLATGYGTIIHEIFHNWAHQLGIDSAHNWLPEFKNKWFDSYKELMEKAPDGKYSERSWYELLLRDQGNSKDHFKIFNKDTMWIPNEATFKKVYDYYKKIGPTNANKIGKLITQANNEFTNKNDKKGMEILFSGLKIAPEHPRLLYTIAYNLHWRMNQRDEAQIYYDQLLDLYEDVNSTDTALTYAISYYINKDPNRVLSLLKRNGQNPPTNQRLSEYKMAEARALKNLKRLDEAKKVASDFLDDPRNTMRDKFVEFLK